MAVEYSDLSRRLDDMTEANERYVEQEADYRATTAREQRVQTAMNTLAANLAELESTNSDGWPRHSAEERQQGIAQLQAAFRQTLAEEEESITAEIAQATVQQEHLEAQARDVMAQLTGAALTRALQLRTIRASHVRIWPVSDLWPQIRAAAAGSDPADRAAWFDVLNERIAELGDNAPADLVQMVGELRAVSISPAVARKLKTVEQRLDRRRKARTDLWDQTREVKLAMTREEMRADPRYAPLA